MEKFRPQRIKKASPQTIHKIVEAIESLADNPHPSNCRN
jgi:hypothetical protein